MNKLFKFNILIGLLMVGFGLGVSQYTEAMNEVIGGVTKEVAKEAVKYTLTERILDVPVLGGLCSATYGLGKLMFNVTNIVLMPLNVFFRLADNELSKYNAATIAKEFGSLSGRTQIAVLGGTFVFSVTAGAFCMYKYMKKPMHVIHHTTIQ
jgi:hypothetical protein